MWANSNPIAVMAYFLEYNGRVNLKLVFGFGFFGLRPENYGRDSLTPS